MVYIFAILDACFLNLQFSVIYGIKLNIVLSVKFNTLLVIRILNH